MKTQIENEAILIADSHHGIYIPQLVVKSQLNNPLWDWSEVEKEYVQSVINGPDDEFYWDAWDVIESNVIINYNGEKYFLVMNEGLWAVPENCADQLEDWII